MEASESDEDGCRLFRLGDDEFGLQLAIDEPTARVALLLEGECTPAALAAGSGLDGAQVERAVRQLRRFFLLDDAAAAELVAEVRATRSWQSTPPHQVPLLVRPDARFACVACGSCCGLQSIGPIRPEELEAIWQHREALHGKIPADGGLFHSVSCGSAGSGGPRVICRLRDGYCVFLAGDRRCLIHRELGAEVKPACCRIFPLQFVATPDGVAVSLNMECRGFLQARCGPPLTDQQDELRRTLSLLPSLRRLRPVILI
ncbi:MAG: YkgJ family cysteine cluster protein, partial [Deltaproteobacteria bacterium]|nr:YkgJ family cysteine cluster protein [Deltaproteobacteria bacterium]